LSRRKAIVRWAVRIALLAAALSLALGGPIPSVLARTFPSLSPLVTATSSVAQRRWYLGWFWLAGPVAMLLLGVWKGRLFCRWICPAGTLYAIPAQWSLKKRLLKVRPNAVLFWLIVGSSLAGVPLLAFLDPLSTFNRLSPLLTGTYTLASLVPGLILPAVIVLSIFQPMIWCAQLCPLGYLFELGQAIRRHGTRPLKRGRRQILAGLLVGVPGGLLARRYVFGQGAAQRRPVLPPGAGDVESFAAACTRCYACVSVCPTKVIQAGFDTSRPIGQWFQPEVVYFDSEGHVEGGYCPEPCNRCSQVCPAGALSPLSFSEKWARQIGVAEIIRSACLAWTDGEACAVCQEVCPYGAVEIDEDDKGLARPVVNRELCRGCGACYSKCPAIRAGKAIRILGVERQKLVDDPELAPVACGGDTDPARRA
jgi:ferredoxin